MFTTDDRVPELIETAISTSGNEMLDLIVVSMSDASPDYKDWVSLQATEQDQTNAYYNVAAFKEGEEPIAHKRVAKMMDFKKKQAKAEGKADWKWEPLRMKTRVILMINLSTLLFKNYSFNKNRHTILTDAEHIHAPPPPFDLHQVDLPFRTWKCALR